MKKRYRKVRSIWVLLVGLVSVCMFMYGCLLWCSIESKILIMGSMVLFGCYLYLGCNRWEIKNCENM